MSSPVGVTTSLAGNFESSHEVGYCTSELRYVWCAHEGHEGRETFRTNSPGERPNSKNFRLPRCGPASNRCPGGPIKLLDIKVRGQGMLGTWAGQDSETLGDEQNKKIMFKIIIYNLFHTIYKWELCGYGGKRAVGAVQQDELDRLLPEGKIEQRR